MRTLAKAYQNGLLCVEFNENQSFFATEYFIYNF
jgi:hypothetical protein